MSTRSGPHSPSGRDREPDGAEDQSAFAAMLDEHEAHVFDYLSRLVGDEAEAASATEVAMNAAQSLLADPDRLRAWLFALARQEIATKIQRADQDQDGEIRDLVYRHGIRPEDLPAVLGVTAEQVQAMLTDGVDAPADAGARGAADVAGAHADVPGEVNVPVAADGRRSWRLTSRSRRLTCRARLTSRSWRLTCRARLTSRSWRLTCRVAADVPAAAPWLAGAAAAVMAGVAGVSVGAAQFDDAAFDEAAELDDAAEFDDAADFDNPDDDEAPAEPPSWIWDRTAAAFIDDSDTDPRGIPAYDEFLAAASAISEPAFARAGPAERPPFSRARRRLGLSAIFVAVAGAAAGGVVYLGGSPPGQADTHAAQKPNTGSARPVVSSLAPTRHTPTARHTHAAAKHHHRVQQVSRRSRVSPPAPLCQRPRPHLSLEAC